MKQKSTHRKKTKKSQKRSTHKNTREQTQGGAIVGKGSQGTVIDITGAEGDNDTLQKKFESFDPVMLQMVNMAQAQYPKIKMTAFKEFITKTHAKDIVKVMTDEKAYLYEIGENDRVFDIYDKANKSDFITLLRPEYTQDDKKYKINGFTIQSKQDKKKNYCILYRKCFPLSTAQISNIVEIKKFSMDILNSLQIINAQNYYHNDVKPDNMVTENISNQFKYRLIDWGASKLVQNANDAVQRGDPVYSSPMKLFITYYNSMIPLFRYRNIPKITLLYETQRGKPSWAFLKEADTLAKISKRKMFLEFLDKKYKEFKEALRTVLNDPDVAKSKEADVGEAIDSTAANTVEKEGNPPIDPNGITLTEKPGIKGGADNMKNAVYAKYHKSFDIYMFGMTLFHLKLQYNIKEPNFDKIIDELTDFKNPVVDIATAISKINALQA